GPPDAEAQAREVVAREPLDCVREAAVTAGAAAGANAEPPEGQVDVVEDDEQIAAQILERELCDRLGDRVTGEVHESLRQQDAHALRGGGTAQPALAVATAVRGHVEAEAAVGGEALGHAPPDVVTRARVARTRIAEADDELHLAARLGQSSF